MHGTWPVFHRRWATGAAVAVCLALIATAAISPASPPDEKKLTIVYSCQASGQIRSCNCTKFRFGGYGRQATLLDQFRSEVGEVLLIEGGDAIRGMRAAQEKLKTEVTMQALEALKYAAYIPGEKEISYAQIENIDLSALTKVPMVAANLLINDKPATEHKYIVYTHPSSKLKVAVIGVVSDDLLNSGFLSKNAEVEDPLEVLPAIIEDARKAADLVVVVAHAEPKSAKNIAGKVKADVLICTHGGELCFPEKGKNIADGSTETIGDCIYVEGGIRSGWSVGRLDLSIESGRVKVEKHRFFYLDRAYSEKEDMLKIYDAYTKKVRDLTLSQSNKMRDELAKLHKQRGFDSSKYGIQKSYVGAQACKECHAEAFAAWEKSRHATAINTLKETKQEYDPECVTCHTTGFGRRGGFTNMEDSPELANVQCESCHGPGAKHVEKPTHDYGKTQEERCRSCHTEELDPDFDYQVRWDNIKH